MLKTLSPALIPGKHIIVRVDFNVPLKNGVITDDSRIRASIPTIRKLIEAGAASLVLISHLGRPKGQVKPELSLSPIASSLSEILEKKVFFAKDLAEAKNLQANAKPGTVILLENIRFDSREEKNDDSLGKQLADLGEVYVNDAFGAAHRAHASTHAITRSIPSFAGLLLEKEYKNLSLILENPTHPYVAVIGGAKVSSKIEVLESLAQQCDTIIIGGAMAYTFLFVLGHSVGKSLVEKDFLETARRFLDLTKKSTTKILLPVDHIAAKEFSEDAKAIPIDEKDIPADLIAMDIGPKTSTLYKEALQSASCIVWNGPMGVFEFESFSKGTKKIAHAIAENTAAHTLCGGGDTLAAIKKWKLNAAYTHVSTGGGASLEFLEGKKLPAIQVLLETTHE